MRRGALPLSADVARRAGGPKLNKSGSRRVTAGASLQYAYHGTFATIVQRHTINKDGVLSQKNHMKTNFTPASLGFCGASPTETEPSKCFILHTMHREAPIPSSGLNLCF